MLIESILGFKGSFRVLLFLSQTPQKPISRSDIKKYTYLGNEAVNTSLRRLNLANILIKEKRGIKEFYYYNLENVFAQEILKIFKLEGEKLRFLDYKTKVILNEFFRKVIDQVSDVMHLSVFGSYAKGNWKKGSDIDISFVVEERDIKSELLLTNIIENLYAQFGVKIEVHYILKRDFIKINSDLIREIKNDEIILFSLL